MKKPSPLYIKKLKKFIQQMNNGCIEEDHIYDGYISKEVTLVLAIPQKIYEEFYIKNAAIANEQANHAFIRNSDILFAILKSFGIESTNPKLQKIQLKGYLLISHTSAILMEVHLDDLPSDNRYRIPCLSIEVETNSSVKGVYIYLYPDSIEKELNK